MKDIGEGDDNDDNAKNDEDGKQNAAKTDQNINPHHMRIEDFQPSTQLPHHTTSDRAALPKRVKPKEQGVALEFGRSAVQAGNPAIFRRCYVTLATKLTGLGNKVHFCPVSYGWENLHKPN